MLRTTGSPVSFWHGNHGGDGFSVLITSYCLYSFQCCHLLIKSLWIPVALSHDGRLEVRGELNCSVLYCVLKLCTVISTLRWAVLTVIWIGFCLTWPISLCLDSFVYMFVFLCYHCHTAYVLYYCNTVRWTWWDWSLSLEHLRSVLWHCCLGHLICKNTSPIWPIMCLVGR